MIQNNLLTSTYYTSNNVFMSIPVSPFCIGYVEESVKIGASTRKHLETPLIGTIGYLDFRQIDARKQHSSRSKRVHETAMTT